MYRVFTSSPDIEYTSKQLLQTDLFNPIGVAIKFFQNPGCIHKLSIYQSRATGKIHGWAFITHGGSLMTFVSPKRRGRGIATELVIRVCRGTVGDLFYALAQQPAFFNRLPIWITERHSGDPDIQALKEKRRPTPTEIACEVRKRLVAVAEDWNKGSLSGMCAISAMALTRSLHEWEHYDAQMVLGRFCAIHDHLSGGNHCWTVVGNRIIDTTATQFGVRNRIVNCRMADRRYNPEKVISNIQSMPRSWPKNQLPLKKLIDQLVFVP